jgi:hypothetical protein
VNANGAPAILPISSTASTPVSIRTDHSVRDCRNFIFLPRKSLSVTSMFDAKNNSKFNLRFTLFASQSRFLAETCFVKQKAA